MMMPVERLEWYYRMVRALKRVDISDATARAAAYATAGIPLDVVKVLDAQVTKVARIERERIQRNNCTEDVEGALSRLEAARQRKTDLIRLPYKDN